MEKIHTEGGGIMINHGDQGREKYLNRITEQLSILAAKAKLSSSGNRNDTAVIAEQTICGLLNRMKGWNLRNANDLGHPNYPAVDLVDEAARVAVQVTVENSLKKVDKMLEVFERCGLDAHFDELYMVILTDKEATKTMKKRQRPYFPVGNIWNISTLQKMIGSGRDVDKLRDIAEYLEKELGYMVPKAEKTTAVSRKPVTSEFIRDHTLSRNKISRNGDAFCTQADKKAVVTITFGDTLDGAPEDAVDLTANETGGVLAWTEKNGEWYALYIAGEGGVYAPEDSGELFCNYENLQSICFGNAFHTENVKRMFGLFWGCKNLTELDLTGWKTSAVGDMSYMFADCFRLAVLNIDDLDTRKASSMRCMFANCKELTELKLHNFNTARVKNMSYMFYECGGLKTLDVSGFVTGSANNMRGMFCGCGGLSDLDVSGFVTGGVTNMVSMFKACVSLKKLDLHRFCTERVENMYAMFWGCEALQKLDLSGFDTSAVKDMSLMFEKCSNLKDLDLSSFTFSQVENSEKFMNPGQTVNGRPWEELFAK